MPYRNVDELPAPVKKKYKEHHQQSAFRKAFNSAIYQQGLSEKNAFRIAHAAAQRAGRGGRHD